MNFEVERCLRSDGRTIFDDGIVRSADLGADRYVLSCGVRSVECDILDIVEAATALIRSAGGAALVMEAVRAVLSDVETRITLSSAPHEIAAL
jgi:hypothetical protein